MLIIRNNTTESINFVPENNGMNFFVYNPNSTEPYNANITYTENGLRLFRPNKYWVAVPNNDIFNNDFEIILNLTLPEIPWFSVEFLSACGFSIGPNGVRTHQLSGEAAGGG